MADVMTPKQRHLTMKHIKSSNTQIEIALRKALWHRGYRYRKNYKKLPGTPDIALTKYQIAIFCDSEFFHGYNWIEKKKRLNSNREYWINKIERNIQRDKKNDQELINLGWSVIHFWGHEILSDVEYCVKAIEELINDTRLQKIIDKIYLTDFDYWKE